MIQNRKIIVTSALPYANGTLHLGHLLEFIQTDIWVRFQRARGHTCYYIGADDGHGTPIMLSAEKQGITPEELIQKVRQSNLNDIEAFNISFDEYHSTHSDENKILCEEIYSKLNQKGHIVRKSIQQFYDTKRKMFLSDRYVKGTCPRCNQDDQYGDNCEQCGATYTPTDLVNPVSILSGTPPIQKETEQLFFRLEHFHDFLKQWFDESDLQKEIANKQKELFQDALRDWDISRNEPYWGFEIPNEKGKYFYVWMEAPIGYISSFKKLCEREKINFDDYLKPDSTTELYHFIGKDIARFHTVFWPAQLYGAGMRTPTGVYAHGFLTINAKKMSKSRATSISAKIFSELLNPEHLRYYFASKLDNGIDDIDFNLDDFQAKIDSDLVGKLVNIASRCARFLERYFSNQLGDSLGDESLYQQCLDKSESIANLYEKRMFSRVSKEIMILADLTNQYIDLKKPWIIIKDESRHDEVLAICTLCLNIFRVLIVYLSPIIPKMSAEVSVFLQADCQKWSSISHTLLKQKISSFSPLTHRVDKKKAEQMLEKCIENDFKNDEKDKNQGNQPKKNIDAVSDQIQFSDFAKIDLRVARVCHVENIENADKLLRLELDIGIEKRQVFSGIKSFYKAEDLIGRLVVVVANLAPRKMRFGVSNGMILSAGDGENIYVLEADSKATPGMKIT